MRKGEGKSVYSYSTNPVLSSSLPKGLPPPPNPEPLSVSLYPEDDLYKNNNKTLRGKETAIYMYILY